VAAIALVIALGTGAYASLGSTAVWRRLSNDASFERLRLHDLRVNLAQGATVAEGDLRVVVDPQVLAIAAQPAVAEARPGLRLVATAGSARDEVDLIVDLLDFDRALWTPTLTDGDAEAVEDGGIVLAEKAAADLGVGPGDTINLQHPRREGRSYQIVTSSIRVAAIHPSPFRYSAYLDLGRAGLFAMDGLTNVVEVARAPGVAEDDVKRALFQLTAVASAQSVTATSRLFEDALEQFIGILRVVELIVLVLALLIAFNTASISVDERRREHATMMAFGLRSRTVLGLTTAESMLTGLLGRLLGVGAGYFVPCGP